MTSCAQSVRRTALSQGPQEDEFWPGEDGEQVAGHM